MQKRTMVTCVFAVLLTILLVVERIDIIQYILFCAAYLVVYCAGCFLVWLLRE